jgi:hypothetical protein
MPKQLYLSLATESREHKYKDQLYPCSQENSMDQFLARGIYENQRERNRYKDNIQNDDHKSNTSQCP